MPKKGGRDQHGGTRGEGDDETEVPENDVATERIVKIPERRNSAPTEREVCLVNMGETSGLGAEIVSHRCKNRVAKLANEPRAPAKKPEQSMQVKAE